MRCDDSVGRTSTLLFHPHHFTLLPRVDIQDLTCDASTPALTREKENTFCNSLWRDRFLKPSRSLAIEPELVWIFCTLLSELRCVNWTRCYSIDSFLHQLEKSYCLTDPHSPSPWPNSAHVPHQAPHQPELYSTLSTCVVCIASLPKMTTLTPHNYQPHVPQVFSRCRL